jgi:hypothetical protein
VVVAVAVAGASVSVFVMPAQALASPDFILQQDFFVSQDFLSFLSLSSSLTMTEKSEEALAMYPEPMKAVSKKATRMFFMVT